MKPRWVLGLITGLGFLAATQYIWHIQSLEWGLVLAAEWLMLGMIYLFWSGFDQLALRRVHESDGMLPMAILAIIGIICLWLVWYAIGFDVYADEYLTKTEGA